MNAGIFLVATQGNIHALYISPKGLIMGMLLAVFLRPWRIEAHLDMIVIVGFLTIVIVGTILPFCLYLAAVKYAGSVYAGLLSSVEP